MCRCESRFVRAGAGPQRRRGRRRFFPQWSWGDRMMTVACSSGPACSRSSGGSWGIACAALALLLISGCSSDMADQPRVEALERSTFFADVLAARPPVEGTIPRGQLVTDEAFATGRSNGEPVREFPVALDEAVLARGRERYDIFCSPCHDRTGYGQGMVVRRGFPAPPSYHIDRLRDAPPGHFFDVMTHGFGRMPSYADKIPPADRWAIVAYIKALQLSQHASAAELAPEDREKLKSPGQ